MATIVLVHGIDQQQKSADTLEAEWLPALAGGVRTAGFPELADRLWRDRSRPRGIETRMAFYGHLFLPKDQQGDDMGELDEDETLLADALAREWVARAAEWASQASERAAAAIELAEIDGRTNAEMMRIPGRVLRAGIRGAARLKPFARFGMAFAERFVCRALAQVSRYFAEESIRKAAINEVLALISPETRVVLAHSLGSVVAFEAMHRLQQPLPLFVTIGSPLGLNSVVRQRVRPQPLAFPPQVKRWVNLADRDDFIATEPDLGGLFPFGTPVGTKLEGGWTVDNEAKPHEGTFYLTKAETGRPVAETLMD